MHAAMRNGPNGTSLFIVNPRWSFCDVCLGEKKASKRLPDGDERNKSGTETTAPRINPKNMAMVPYTGPRSHPMPSTSFASPNPIHVPPENSHKRKKGAASAGPATRTVSMYPVFGYSANIEYASARAAKVYAHSSGI